MYLRNFWYEPSARLTGGRARMHGGGLQIKFGPKTVWQNAMISLHSSCKDSKGLAESMAFT